MMNEAIGSFNENLKKQKLGLQDNAQNSIEQKKDYRPRESGDDTNPLKQGILNFDPSYVKLEQRQKGLAEQDPLLMGIESIIDLPQSTSVGTTTTPRPAFQS